LADLAPEQDFIDEDAVPEISRIPATIPGDLWILGKHLLFCGDSTSEETLQQLLKGETAAMAIVDFPYNTNYRQRRRANQPALRIANDDLEEEQFEQFLYSACVQILAGTHGAVYLFMSSNHLHTLFKAFTGAGGHWSTFLVWAKDRFALGRSDYQRMFELILYGWKEGNPHFWCGARDEGDLWFVPKPKANRLHPTMKPVSLIERAIRNSSQRGDLVLDLFGGGGVDPDRL
jgi:DNA modification methylase